MPKRKTKPGEIRNPEHYFNRYIAREILKDREKPPITTRRTHRWKNCRQAATMESKRTFR